MATLVTCMGESLIDFVPLKVTGLGEGNPEDPGKVLPGDTLSTDFRMHSGATMLEPCDLVGPMSSFAIGAVE